VAEITKEMPFSRTSLFPNIKSLTIDGFCGWMQFWKLVLSNVLLPDGLTLKFLVKTLHIFKMIAVSKNRC